MADTFVGNVLSCVVMADTCIRSLFSVREARLDLPGKSSSVMCSEISAACQVQMYGNICAQNMCTSMRSHVLDLHTVHAGMPSTLCTTHKAHIPRHRSHTHATQRTHSSPCHAMHAKHAFVPQVLSALVCWLGRCLCDHVRVRTHRCFHGPYPIRRKHSSRRQRV